jgi:Cu/Ag efflux protein CusF
MSRTIQFAIAVAAVAALAGFQAHSLSAEEGKKTPQAAGKVKSVDASAGTITLEGKSKEGVPVAPEKTFKLAADVKVSINGESKSLADVTAGLQVALALSDDGQTVVAINAGAKKEGGKEAGKEGDGGSKLRTISGTLSAVEGSSLTITRKGDSGVTSDTVASGAATKFYAETDENEIVKGEGGKEGSRPKLAEATAASLKVGQRVTAAVGTDGTAVKVLIHRPAPPKASGEK